MYSTRSSMSMFPSMPVKKSPFLFRFIIKKKQFSRTWTIDLEYIRNKLEKPIIYYSMRLHLFFRGIKIAASHLICTRSYSKEKTHPLSFKWVLVLWSISQKNRALFSLSLYIMRKFSPAFSQRMQYLGHYFWIALSIII